MVVASAVPGYDSLVRLETSREIPTSLPLRSSYLPGQRGRTADGGQVAQ